MASVFLFSCWYTKDYKHMDTNNMQEKIREIRKEFFAFRNGIVADNLRRAGDPHSMIMGCLLVDIRDITTRVRNDIGDAKQLEVIAQELWNDTNSRECRLAAPMLYPAESMTLELASTWCDTVETVEIADNLCHKLLRHMKDAPSLMSLLITQESALVKYTGYRLLLNLLLLGKVKPNATLRDIVEDEAIRALPPLKTLLRDIVEELGVPD